MAAREVFEGIRLDVLELKELERRITECRNAAQIGARSLQYAGHSGSTTDGTKPALYRLLDLEAKAERLKTRVSLELERADAILYGKGGIAESRSLADADSLHGYYCQGLTWKQVASEIATESKDGRQWCMRRAHRALAWIDGL